MVAEPDELLCPRCARSRPAGERFCESCGMPLVHAGGGEARVSESQRRARKIKPQYAEGEPVKVARASNLAEAELISGLLLEEGIPSLVRRSGGSDVPDFLAAGARDILVPQSAAQAAREALEPDAAEDPEDR
jgi:hypothetical protein